MTISPILSSFFNIISNTDNIIVYYFNPVNNHIAYIEQFSKESIFDKNIYTYKAIENGYYIVIINNKISVLGKGNIPYYAFMLNSSSEDSITVDAYFIDSTKSIKTFNKLKDNLYMCNLSEENRRGWFNVKNMAQINKRAFEKNIIFQTTKVVSNSNISNQIKTTQLSRNTSQTIVKKPVSTSKIIR